VAHQVLLGTVLKAADAAVGKKLGLLRDVRSAWEGEEGQVDKTVAKVKRQHKRARYDLFFDLQPFLDHLDKVQPTTEEQLRDYALVLLRVSTLARSFDLSNLLPHLYVPQNQLINNNHLPNFCLIKSLTKGDIYRTWSITGRALGAITQYVALVEGTPCAYMFRHIGKHWLPLSSERISKITLNMMEKGGLNTDTFKAHALRGACATHLLSRGADPTLVRQRGGWSTNASFEANYCRLHQHLDWEGFLFPVNELENGAMCGVGVPGPEALLTRSRPSGRRREEGEGEGTPTPHIALCTGELQHTK
jgi:integrase